MDIYICALKLSLFSIILIYFALILHNRNNLSNKTMVFLWKVRQNSCSAKLFLKANRKCFGIIQQTDNSFD